MDYQWGLKGCLARWKGSGILLRFKMIAREIKYAWQRAWRGYDFRDVKNLGFNIVDKMPVLLKEFKKHNHQLFVDDNNRFLNETETENIIDRLIYCFENSNEDYVYERLFGIQIWEDKYDKERCNKVAEEIFKNKKEAFNLLEKWTYNLWI